MTIVVQIGNTDDKLTQGGWAHFCSDLMGTVSRHDVTTHFSGGSSCTMPWQNYCMVFEQGPDLTLHSLLRDLQYLAHRHKQDSIAVTIGDTIFLNGAEEPDA